VAARRRKVEKRGAVATSNRSVGGETRAGRMSGRGKEPGDIHYRNWSGGQKGRREEREGEGVS